MSKHTTTTTLVLTSMALLLVTQELFADGVSRRVILSNNCVTCHGPDGRGAKKIPKLKGLSATDIIQSMNGFQTGEEKSTIMMRHAKGYTDEDIKLMAEYFASK